MNFSNRQLLDMIAGAGVRPSAQRIAVLDRIANGQRHPSADEIFRALAPQFPSLSLTTVYNSLRILQQAGLVRELQLTNAGGGKRFDLAPQPPHAHFLCRRCGRVFDMAYPGHLHTEPPFGYSIEEVDVYLHGVCPDCQDKQP